MKAVRGRRGFTLIEIMVVMTIIAILISILVPAIGYVRETARGSQCRASLRQFYIGFTGLADRNKEGKYTSGAFDGGRDGCIDTVGWVADLVNAKVCKPIELLCPSSPAQGCEKYKEYLGTTATLGASEEASSAFQDNTGACKSANIVWKTANTPATVADNFMAKGYGTNHMTTWFMSRSAPVFKSVVSGTGVVITFDHTKKIKAGPTATATGARGPLTRRLVDGSTQTANTIPLMGDSAVGDTGDRFLDQDLKGTDGTVYLLAGSPLAESFSDGPATTADVIGWSKGTTDPTIYDSAAPTTGVVGQEQPGKGLRKLVNGDATHLQDYRDFGAHHGGSANILFADGSVKSFQDLNGDGFLNPGFVGGAADVKGYTDGTVELPAAEIFSGVLLESLNITAKGAFDG